MDWNTQFLLGYVYKYLNENPTVYQQLNMPPPGNVNPGPNMMNPAMGANHYGNSFPFVNMMGPIPNVNLGMANNPPYVVNPTPNRMNPTYPNPANYMHMNRVPAEQRPPNPQYGKFYPHMGNPNPNNMMNFPNNPHYLNPYNNMGNTLKVPPNIQYNGPPNVPPNIPPNTAVRFSNSPNKSTR